MSGLRAWARTVDPGWWLVAAAVALLLVTMAFSPAGQVQLPPPPTVGQGVYTAGECP
jgi:hypothetical protein